MEKSTEEEECTVLTEEKNGFPSSTTIVAPLTPPLNSVEWYKQSGRKELSLKSKTRVLDGISEPLTDSLQQKKRCAWVTPYTDPSYATFHDEEWGLPVHDDNVVSLLHLLIREVTVCREVFADFDPIMVAKFNEKKITSPGSTASSLLSELKLRAIIENARQMSKVIDEFGSFDNTSGAYSMNARPAAEGKEANDVTLDDDVDEKKTGEAMEPEICRATDELSLALE
ncbi:hypothetical protein Vadar_017616 [Vaccinium darrowii]|uniref:Uncharacterized protein n=1 Tax=Vaccinium darrowii TaxID=229202 RepID=A0ACB7Z4Y1_9ERIC|nr:hypothetical protein Vadar_017616 [Vaccinium darrowii]